MCISDATDDGEAAEPELPTLLTPPTRHLNVPGSHKPKCTNSAYVATASIHEMIKEENDAMRKWSCYALLNLTRPRKKPHPVTDRANCFSHASILFVY